MITGDNIDTAKAIGKEVGLITSPTDIILSSAEFNQKSDEELKKLFFLI